MNEHRRRGAALLSLAIALSGAFAASPAHAADLSYLQGLLASAPDGGWVKASTSAWGLTWPTPTTEGDPAGVVVAWSSVAWDSSRGQLILWGGGHANYGGNEVYLWQGLNGQWTRGSLPSALGPNDWVVGNGAPQSSHTYDNNLYLPLSDRFVTFGGAAWNSGDNFASAQGREGPWLWNPSLADPNKVGGADFTGVNASALGSNSWLSRRGAYTGTLPPSTVDAATAYRSEAGRDVVYIAADTGASGFPSLYRYDFNLSGTDAVQKVGVMGSGTYTYQGTAAIDSAHGWFARTAWDNGVNGGDLAVWDLSASNAADPSLNRSYSVRLQRPDGSPFNISSSSGTGSSTGLAFSELDGNFYLWNGTSINVVTPMADSNGKPAPVWTVTTLPYTTSGTPNSLGQGVLGKFIYIAELDAFLAVSGYNSTTKDAEIWLYNPANAVPEPGSVVLWGAGLGFFAWRLHSRRAATAPTH